MARFKIAKGVAIILFDNKRVRTRNYWYEVRGLAILARHLDLKFFHSVQMQFNDGQMTEIDGLDVESRQIMVELKQTLITQKWIDFIEKKRIRLGLKQCILCAPIYDENLQIPSSLNIFRVCLDHTSLYNYYKDDFQLPEWFSPCISDRHLRALLSNGIWYGFRRKLTQTAKHTPTTKIKLGIENIFKRGKFPIRLYYSLAPMVIPQRDYFGRGYPLPRVMAAFDVDSDHKPHLIGKEGYCLKCLKEAKQRCDLIREILTDMGWKTHVIHSGFKGYHIYCLEEDEKFVELSIDQIQNILPLLKDENNNPLTDNDNFKSRNGSFDLHRIFKLPNSIDAVTGIQVVEKLKRLEFKDQISEIS